MKNNANVNEQEKVIKELRVKSLGVKFSEVPKTVTKIDKKVMWEKAKKAGKTVRNDDLPTANSVPA